MSPRVQIAILFLAPVLLVAGLFALGRTIPLPVVGRGYVVRIELPRAGASLDLPPVGGPQDPSRPLVVIDAGHGGHDPGASGDGFREKTLALGLARALRDRLLEQGGIRVALTRDEDKFLVLDERSEIARRLGADLFLSIHADSAGDRSGVSGASIYTLSASASDEASARFAARENNADRVNGVNLEGRSDAVNSILVDLSQRRTQGQSSEFASLILREGEGHLAFHPRPLRSAALVVLRAPDVPSVLYESGFISNPEDAQRLASPQGRAEFTEVMARAIRVYFARQASI
jgi:N-acetylmuramoyl-L-alanine amidase